jgi:peptide/nickel transport system permease protein
MKDALAHSQSIPDSELLRRSAHELARSSRLASFWRKLRLSDALALSSLGVVLLVLFAAMFPTLLAPYLPTDMQGDAVLSPPDALHRFGTDQYGRDVFSMVIYGARQSVLIGAFAVLVGCSIGTTVGLTAGYVGGWVDSLLMRAIDVWMAIPSVLLAISLSAALGPSLVTTIIAVSLVAVPRYARVLRGQALSVRHRPFVQAARAAGASHFAILRGHVLPHCAAPIFVLGTLGIANSILLGASLSFLGLGVNDDCPDWGYLLTQGRGYLTVAWWTVTYPGLAITALVISVNLFGDALRRQLDPRSAPR